jgi:pimeloyl-ACP methyl ester carboxylesterase
MIGGVRVLPIVMAALLSLLCSFTPARAIDTVVSLTVPRTPVTGSPPVIQRFIMLDLAAIPPTVPDPIEAKGVLVLFTGGNGKLGIGDAQLSILQTNFLVRTRHLFAAQGFHVAVADAATDFLLRPEGLGNDRTSAQHMQDVAMIISYLRGRFPGLPIWLVGTSRGTISAANAAAVLTGTAAPDGIVLTSSLTREGVVDSESLQDVPLGQITVPAFVGAHRDDGCAFTPPEDARELFRTLRKQNHRSHLRFFEGGFAPFDDPCEALAAHGFFGIESRVVEAIGKFIRSLGTSP